MNFPPNSQGMNPDDYAMMYAQQHGISVDAAKNELRAKYGDPQQQANSSVKQPLLQFDSGNNVDANFVLTADNKSKQCPIPKEAQAELRKLGIPQSVIDKGDKAIKEYAEKHKIKLPPKKPPREENDNKRTYYI